MYYYGTHLCHKIWSLVGTGANIKLPPLANQQQRSRPVAHNPRQPTAAFKAGHGGATGVAFGVDQPCPSTLWMSGLRHPCGVTAVNRITVSALCAYVLELYYVFILLKILLCL
jgi:hypothetical protein